MGCAAVLAVIRGLLDRHGGSCREAVRPVRRCPWKGDHPWMLGRGEGMAPSERLLDNFISLGPRRIFCLRGSYRYTTISRLSVGGERGVGGIGGGGVGKDGVEVRRRIEQ